MPSIGRGRGRPSRVDLQKEARDAEQHLIAQKKRLGGPGMDRGGATLVNEKRRRGFIENEYVDEELVDATE